MAIVWMDIWDTQSGQNAKSLINRYFNIRSYIMTICGVNMNPSIPQCKNCWKWDHTIFACQIQESKCVKCSSPYKSEHHQHFVWCCKVNFKINLPRLETKQEGLCSHLFKYTNCKGNYQADSNLCSFWKH